MESKKETYQKDELKENFPLIIKVIAALIAILIGVQKNYFAYYKPKAIILVIAIPMLCLLCIDDIDYLPLIIGACLIIFLEIIDNHLWKYPPFSWMFTLEDFSGTYKGNQVGQHLKKIGKMANNDNVICKEYEKKLRLTLIIHQTGSKIITYSFYYDSDKKKSSKSESDKVMIAKGEYGKHLTLSYHYGNIGVLKKGGHRGITILKLIKNNNTFCLEGGYYTNKNPQTRGEFINLKRVSKLTEHPF